MTEDLQNDAKDRLQALGISICYGGRSFPDGAKNGNGHLSIQTSGYGEADLKKALPLLHDLEETFELEFLGDVADDDLRQLVGLRNILSLKASHGPVSDAGLQHLTGLTSLRVLEFWGLPVTTAGVKHLTGLTNLCELQLSGSQVDDEGLAALSGLTELTELKLNGCPVTDRGLESLSRLTKLRTLDLGGTRIQGPGLVHLERLGDLEDLTLDRLPISDCDVSVLRRLGKLRSLSLHSTQVGDGGAPWLAGLPHLGWLTLSDTRIGDDAVRQLRSCEGLINVRLDGTKVSGVGLAQLPKDLHVLSVTEVDLQEADIAGLEHLKNLSSLLIDKRAASEAVVGLRRMHLVPRPAYDESVVAFVRLRDCPLCRDVIEDGSPVFVMRPFYIAEYWQYAKVPIHWDCFARWEKRPDFARRYFEANVGGADNNQFWGVAYRDEQCFVSVNPSQYVEEVQVMLAETASDFRVKLADWQDWLEGEWFESCRHEVEREALGRMIPLFREKFPTTEVVVKAVGFSPEEPPAKPEGMVGQLSYEFACDDLARRAAQKGIACPHCGEFSNDYEYRKVEMVDPDGPRSVLVCQKCDEEFGPDDV